MRRRNYSSIWRGVALAVDPASFGSTLIDASTGNNHGESAGSGNEITPVGNLYAIKTNGSGRYVTPIVRHGIGTGDFTLSAWIIPDAISSGWRCIWSNGNTNAPAFYATTVGTGAWGLWSGSLMASGRILTAGVKTHLCARRMNGTLEFWTDGVKEAATVSYSGSLPDAASIFFSESSSSQAASLSGCMRDFVLHNRAITEAEIRVLAMRCGIVHEMANRHASRNPFNAAWIRSGSRVIGGGVF